MESNSSTVRRIQIKHVARGICIMLEIGAVPVHDDLGAFKSLLVLLELGFDDGILYFGNLQEMYCPLGLLDSVFQAIDCVHVQGWRLTGCTMRKPMQQHFCAGAVLHNNGRVISAGS